MTHRHQPPPRLQQLRLHLRTKSRRIQTALETGIAVIIATEALEDCLRTAQN
jgi:hypothetical protein